MYPCSAESEPLIIWSRGHVVKVRGLPRATTAGAGAQLTCAAVGSCDPAPIPTGSGSPPALRFPGQLCNPRCRAQHPEMIPLTHPQSLLGQSFQIYDIANNVIESGMSWAQSGPEMLKAAHSGMERRNKIDFQRIILELCLLRPLHPPFPLSLSVRSHEISSSF